MIGGIICLIGQCIKNIAQYQLMMNEQITSSFTSVIMIGIGAFLTALGVYDVIGKFAGAGSIIPITGFANSVVAPAMEYKTEGVPSL